MTQQPTAVRVDPTGVPARCTDPDTKTPNAPTWVKVATDLPQGMLSDVADALERYGLRFRDAAEQDATLWAVLLTRVDEIVAAVPTEFGGRA